MRCQNLLRVSAVGVSLFIVSSAYAKSVAPTRAESKDPEATRQPTKTKPKDKTARRSNTNRAVEDTDNPHPVRADAAADPAAQPEPAAGKEPTRTHAPKAASGPASAAPAVANAPATTEPAVTAETKNTSASAAAAPSATPAAPPAERAISRYSFSATLTAQTSKQLALGLLAPPTRTPAWHTLTVKRGDTLSQMFSRSGLKAKDWLGVLAIGDKTAPLKKLRPGDTLQIQTAASGELAKLRFPIDAVKTLTIARRDGTLHAKVVRRPLTTRRIRASATVDGSLWKSLSRAGVPARVATRLARIYSYRVNLSRNVHAGDRFSVIYQAGYADGKQVEVGPVIAADFATGDKSFKAFRAVDDHGTTRYYDPGGHSYKPSISRHPVNYTRISSPFSYSRMNPVLHIRRPHTGVDMAAARGTPVRAAADGTVKFVGRNGGYGRLVELKHFDHYSTRYGHLSRYAKGLHDGEHVTQGQVIGYVGATGIATGPHLHFEIRQRGVAHNPMTMKLPNGTPLPKTRVAAFSERIKPLIAKLDGTSKPTPPQVAQVATNHYWLVDLGRCGDTGKLTAMPRTTPDAHAINTDFMGNNLFCVVASNNGA